MLNFKKCKRHLTYKGGNTVEDNDNWSWLDWIAFSCKVFDGKTYCDDCLSPRPTSQ